MKFKIFLVIFISIIFDSCTKKDDKINFENEKLLEYHNTFPPDGFTNANIHTRVDFSYAYSDHYENEEFLFDIYFDSIKEPKQVVETDKSSLDVGLLLPNHTYYWKIVSIKPGGFESKTYNFTTSGFNGNWKLCKISDKRELLEKFKLLAAQKELVYSWSDWDEWDSYSVFFVDNIQKRINDIPISELIELGIDFENIIINEEKNEAMVKYYGNANNQFILCSFEYRNGQVTFKENISGKFHRFPAVNVGSIMIYHAPKKEEHLLVLVKSNGMVLIYKNSNDI